MSDKNLTNHRWNRHSLTFVQPGDNYWLYSDLYVGVIYKERDDTKNTEDMFIFAGVPTFCSDCECVVQPDQKEDCDIKSYNYKNVVANKYCSVSDSRLKSNIKKLNKNIIHSIDKLEPVSYKLNNTNQKNIHYGLIAQQVEEILGKQK